jgi:Holliday junction DNA helicase RuvA
MVTLQVVTQVREDAITLFGFATRDDKAAFLKLTTIQGVGAKMALSLLSAFTPEQIWRAIVSDDKKSLTSADGVGPKLAARLTTELKDYASKQLFPSGNVTLSRTVTKGTSNQNAPISKVQEAVSALTNLGYSPSDAARAVSIASNDHVDADLGTLIKHALREVVS